jgi:hypothetical protein
MTEEQEPEAPPAPPVAPEPRRYPSTIGGSFYLGVLLIALLGIGLVGIGVDWRIGIRVLAVALYTDGLMRAILRDRDAGMLAVRKRWLDATVMFVVATILLVLSVAIPEQPV